MNKKIAQIDDEVFAEKDQELIYFIDSVTVCINVKMRFTCAVYSYNSDEIR